MERLPAWAVPLRGRAGLDDLRPGIEPGCVVLRFGLSAREIDGPGDDRAGWLCLRNPRLVLRARTPGDVVAVLAEAEFQVHAGRVAVCFLAYDAAPAFDPAFRVRRPGGSGDLLAWIGVYEHAWAVDRLPGVAVSPFRRRRWRASVSASEHARQVDRARAWIAAGDVYQINLTQRLRTRCAGDPWALFQRLAAAQPSAHAAFLNAGERILCSASPELLFRLDGEEIVTRPMKGTRPRGLGSEADREIAVELLRSAKERAENLMIVDMARNDLGRIAETGTVRVTSLYDLERYPTVWQLTSTVRARTTRSVPEILRALFPAASITGAPKVRAMEIIAGLETDARGPYTGSIGVWGPGRRAEFNVSIRTAVIDPQSGRAEYGTGGGIVWDSRAAEERAETRWKAAVAASSRRPRDFDLLETMLWTPERGFVLRERHLARLLDSADYFGFAAAETRLRGLLRRLESAWRARDGGAHVLRLRLDRSGQVRWRSRPAPPPPVSPWEVALARDPVDPADGLLYHKTTRRHLYARARRAAGPGVADVLLWNRRGELTESTIANLVLEWGATAWTPPIACGVLPGTMRADLLASGRMRERTLTVEDLSRAERAWLVNSVRGWIPIRVARRSPL